MMTNETAELIARSLRTLKERGYSECQRNEFFNEAMDGDDQDLLETVAKWLQP